MADRKKVLLEIVAKLSDDEVKKLESELDNIENDEINVKLDTTNAMLGLQTIKDGLMGLKSSIQEIGQQFSEVMSSAGKYETNLAYLANNMGLDSAKTKMEEINDIVAKLPGDDTAIGGILSSAAARDSSLTKENLESIASSAADYMAAMSYYGKTATEAQQDMTNYILTGNTAELERSPILSSHIDKLKQATTIQERQKVLAEALNQEGWGGMSQADTYNNKLETFNGMLERGRQNLGLMFMEGSKGAMDFLINLDGATGGMVGLTAAAFGFLEPVGQGLISIGQMGQGLKTLGINGENLQKLGGHLKDIATTAFDAARGLAEAGKAALAAGLNALKSAGMWMAEKIQIIASTVAKGAATVASYALAIAEWLLASPILLIVVAIVALIGVLWYLYTTNESVKAAIDGFAQALWGLGEAIYGGIQGALQWLIDGFTFLYDTITNVFTTTSGEGNNWLTTMAMVMMGPIGWILLLIQHWNQIVPAVSNALSGMYNAAVGWFAQTIAGIIAFGVNLVMEMKSRAKEAVDSFLAPFVGLVDAISAELEAVKSAVMSYIQPLVDAFNQLGSAASWAFSVLGLGQKSPGDIYKAMKRELDWTTEFVEKDKSGLAVATAGLGSNIVDNFNPQLNSVGNYDTVSNSGTRAVGGLTMNIVINGDVDSEERMEKFADYIINRMNWDNTTAGRTV